MLKLKQSSDDAASVPHPLTGRFLAGRMRHDLSRTERDIVESLIGEVVDLEPGHRLIAQGDVLNFSTMLIDGFMLRTMESGDRRHAVSFHVPGDFVDLHCYALKKLDHNIDCVGPVTIGKVPHERLTAVMNEHPHLARTFWFSTLLDAAMHREWISKLEQLQAPQRIAHVVAEIWHRLNFVDLARGNGFDTPLRQADLADMIGTSAVHTNRALTELRTKGLLTFAHGKVEFADLAAVERHGAFDPTYLYEGTGISLRSDGMGAG